MTAAATEAVVAGMARWANPSSPHAEGRAARAALEQARGAIGAAYGWDGEVLLTSGASEALAIGLERATVACVLASAVEHDAVFRARGDAAVLPVGVDGLLSPDLPPGGPPFLLCAQWANSETGVIQPIPAIAEAVHAAGGLLLLDAAQMPAGADPDSVAAADLVALSAHKRGGPPGVGALLVRDLAMLTPTGGQERGYRPGTENLPGVLGYAAALAEPEPLARWTELRARLDDAITRSGGEVVAVGSARHPAIGSYRMPGTASAAQLIRFDLAGISVSAGSACASGSLKPSRTLKAIGLPDEVAGETIRVSLGWSTTGDDITRFLAQWIAIARAARRRV
jgi:cysteine desulfurase